MDSQEFTAPVVIGSIQKCELFFVKQFISESFPDKDYSEELIEAVSFCLITVKIGKKEK